MIVETMAASSWQDGGPGGPSTTTTTTTSVTEGTSESNGAGSSVPPSASSASVSATGHDGGDISNAAAAAREGGDSQEGANENSSNNRRRRRRKDSKGGEEEEDEEEKVGHDIRGQDIANGAGASEASSSAVPTFWERQGSSLQPEYEYLGGNGGGGDSSDTLGADSDEEADEEEMAAALVAAAAAAAAAGEDGAASLSVSVVGGGGNSNSISISSSSSTTPTSSTNSGGIALLQLAGGGLGAMGAGSRPGSRAPSPVSGSTSAGGFGHGLSTVNELETSSCSCSAVSTSASSARVLVGSFCGNNRLAMPSILPHTEALLAIRERSQQLYVPLPAAISRTFGEENNSMIDRRAWLEVEDRKHRYAKNLRLYYKEWDRRGQPGSSFWSWLDMEDVELEECSREQLEAETVQYCCSPEERQAYEVQFQEGGLLHRRNGEPQGDWALVNTGPDGWIFVLRDRIVYAHEKKTDQPPRFHHSSFFAGECVQAAGLFVASHGVLERLYPHSGHYRPTDSHLLSLLLFLESQGVELQTVQVDVQLVMKVARAHDANKGGRKRKIDSPYMWTGLHAKHFLVAKRYSWEHKLFDDMVKHPLSLARC